MKTRLLTIFSAIGFLAASCAEDPDKGSVWEDPKFIRIVAPTEAVASGSSELEIFYKEGQLIKVWEQGGNSVDLTINKDKDSVFFSYEWFPEAIPAYAAFPSTEEATCSSEGLFSVTLDHQQKISGASEIENFVAVGKITGANRTSYKASPMKNITGFLCLEVAFPNISSIDIEAVGGEPVAGQVSVDCAKLEKGEADYMTVVSENQLNSVSLVPADPEGTINAGKYYAALLPGTYSKGLRVTVNYKQGLPVVKTYFEDGVTIRRSTLTMLDDEPIDDDLPDEIRVDLKFSEGWPFVETIVSKEDQEAANYAGDTYTHMLKYEANGVEKEKGLSFFIKGNAQAYEYTSSRFKPGAKNSRMTLPAISGRYIRAVKMETTNAADYPKGFKLTNMSWKDLATCPQKSYDGLPATLSFPTQTGAKSELGAAYYMYFIDASPLITTISILYSKELPSSYEDNPFGDETVEPEPPVEPETDLPEDFSITLNFEQGWPFNETCAAKETQKVTGEPYTYTYNYEVEGEQKSENMNFFISKGGMATDYSYEYVDGALFFDSDLTKQNSTAMIALPVVPSRYLKEVRAVHNGTPYVHNGTNYYPRFNLQKGFLNEAGTALDTSNGKTYGRMDPGVETVMSLPFEKSAGVFVHSELDVTYAVRMRDNDLRMTKLVITYSKTKPE